MIGGLAGPVGENGLGERGYRWFLTPWGCVAQGGMGATVGVSLWLLYAAHPAPLALEGHFTSPRASGAQFWVVSEVPGGNFWVDFDAPMGRWVNVWLTFLPLRAVELCVVDNFVKVCCGDASRLRTGTPMRNIIEGT